MNISEVRIKMVRQNSKKLLAFGSITIDNEFVIRDLKIVRGSNGVFVAMPSRKLTDRCPKCKCKNYLRASFCNDCGATLRPERGMRDTQGRKRLYADIAHPINTNCRDELQKVVLEAYEKEMANPSHQVYSGDFDDYDDFDDYENDGETAENSRSRGNTVDFDDRV